VIRHAELNPDVPIFVPVHPRIATTVSFPRPIGEPLGTGFIDAENVGKVSSENAKTPPMARGEYVIDYEQGDTFFTVQPTARSELLNLNVPFEGATIVFYFYPVQSPLSALASLILQDKPLNAARARASQRAEARRESPTHLVSKVADSAKTNLTAAISASAKSIDSRRASFTTTAENLPADATENRIQKLDTAPLSKFLSATPARLDGFLRKLHMVHAAQTG
jgi:hypothetical protein